MYFKGLKSFNNQLRKTRGDKRIFSLLCCFLYFKGKRKNLVSSAVELYRKCKHLIDHTTTISIIDSIGHFLHIDFHALNEKRIFINRLNFERTIIFVLYKNKQFQLIQRPEVFMRQFLCTTCTKTFSKLDNLHRHTIVCTLDANDPPIEFRDKTGPFRERQLIFERLRACGIDLTQQQVNVLQRRFFATYDSETYFFREQEGRMNTASYLFKGKHHMFFLVAAHNLSTAYECSMFYPRSETDYNWIDRFVKHLLKLAELAKSIYVHVARNIFRQLEQQKADAKRKSQTAWLARLQRAESDLTDYYSCLPVYSYFGSYFDLNVGRTSGLFASLQRLDGAISCLKRGTKYLLLRSKHLIFYDITLLSGCKLSYKAYLKKYRQTDEKAELPYRVFQNYQDLQRPLPVYEDFQDDLRLTNSLNYDHELYTATLPMYHGDSKATLKALGMSAIPLPGPEVYLQLRSKWEAKGFRCLMDVLKFYCYQVCMYVYASIIVDSGLPWDIQ